MKLGLGFYRHQLNRDHYRFAKQCGCSQLVIHLVDYFKSYRSNQALIFPATLLCLIEAKASVLRLFSNPGWQPSIRNFPVEEHDESRQERVA